MNRKSLSIAVFYLTFYRFFVVAADVDAKLTTSNGSTKFTIQDSGAVPVGTINSDGQASFNSVTQTGAGGNLILNKTTLQSGATFYISSGTVSGQISVNSIKFPSGPTMTTARAPRHVYIGKWGATNLAASQTNLQMTFEVASAAQVAAGSRMPMPAPGIVKGICVSGSAARTAGTATFQVFENAVDIGASSDAVIDGTNTQFVCSSAGTATFVAGDILDVRVTTDASFAPTTTEYTASIIVDFTN